VVSGVGARGEEEAGWPCARAPWEGWAQPPSISFSSRHRRGRRRDTAGVRLPRNFLAFLTTLTEWAVESNIFFIASEEEGASWFGPPSEIVLNGLTGLRTDQPLASAHLLSR
jgi:hypothetical protein